MSKTISYKLLGESPSHDSVQGTSLIAMYVGIP